MKYLLVQFGGGHCNPVNSYAIIVLIFEYVAIARKFSNNKKVKFKYKQPFQLPVTGFTSGYYQVCNYITCFIEN